MRARMGHSRVSLTLAGGRLGQHVAETMDRVLVLTSTEHYKHALKEACLYDSERLLAVPSRRPLLCSLRVSGVAACVVQNFTYVYGCILQ